MLEIGAAFGIVVVGATARYCLGALERQPKKWSSAGGVVINLRGEVAIVLQRDRKNRLHWTLPKGRIDRGENAADAALREVYEETGLRARLLRPLLTHEGPRHYTHYFEMALERDDGKHDDETKQVSFVPLFEAARQLDSARDLAVLRRLIELRTGILAATAVQWQRESSRPSLFGARKGERR